MERPSRVRDGGASAATARPPVVPAPGRGTPKPGAARPATPRAPARRPTRSARWRRHWAIAVWMLPAALVMALVFGYSVVELYIQAVTNEGAWAGLANGRLVLSDPDLRAAVGHHL